MDMDTWKWPHGHGHIDIATWSWPDEHGHMDMDTWTWSWTLTPGHGQAQGLEH